MPPAWPGARVSSKPGPVVQMNGNTIGGMQGRASSDPKAINSTPVLIGSGPGSSVKTEEDSSMAGFNMIQPGDRAPSMNKCASWPRLLQGAGLSCAVSGTGSWAVASCARSGTAVLACGRGATAAWLLARLPQRCCPQSGTRPAAGMHPARPVKRGAASSGPAGVAQSKKERQGVHR